MLGQDKSAKARQDFSLYGELMRSAGLPLTVGYTGHRWDPAIGQYFAPFRYYNPQTARWNMRDPLGMLAGLNIYAYVVGDPTNSSDPLGLAGRSPLIDCGGGWKMNKDVGGHGAPSVDIYPPGNNGGGTKTRISIDPSSYGKILTGKQPPKKVLDIMRSRFPNTGGKAGGGNLLTMLLTVVIFALPVIIDAWEHIPAGPKIDAPPDPDVPTACPADPPIWIA